MEIIFLNTLEKEEEGKRYSAQIMINEEDGICRVLWVDRETMEQEEWYAGSDWSQMQSALREQAAKRRQEGYTPLVRLQHFEAVPAGWDQRSRLLSYYAENHFNSELYSHLREWRQQSAAQEGRPLYQIMSNRLLRMVAAYIPHNPEELTQIPGIGEQKLKQYADSLLAETVNWERQRDFPLDWVAGEVDGDDFQAWAERQMETRRKQWEKRQKLNNELEQLMEQGKDLEQLSGHLEIPPEDIIRHMEGRREEMELSAWLDMEIHKIPEKERTSVMRCFEKEGDRYLKPVARRVYGEDLGGLNANEIYTKLRILRLRYRLNHEREGVTAAAETPSAS